MSEWYGWIPIMTAQLQKGYFITKLKFSSLSFETNNADEYLLPIQAKRLKENRLVQIFNREWREQLKARLTQNENSLIFYTLVQFDDIDHKNLDPIVIVIDKKTNTIKEVLIANSDNLERSHLININNLEDTGLVHFTINETMRSEDAIAHVVYDVIRSVYHDHVYAPEGDSLLKPVKTNNKTEAVNLILRQYELKVIQYHKKIRTSLNEAREQKDNSYKKLSQIREDLINAKGELIHALSYVNLMKLEDVIKDAFKNSQTSIENLLSLQDSYVAERGIRANLLVFILTFVVVVITSFSLIQVFLPDREGLSLGLSFVAGIFYLFGCWPLVHWFTFKRTIR